MRALLVLAVLGSIATRVAAQETVPPPPGASLPAPAAPGVVYGRIDRATVRVLAVGGVGVSSFTGSRFVRAIAEPETGHGSGVVIDPRGVVLTARHVVEDTTHVAVRFPHGGGVRPAFVVYRDSVLDFAILLVDTQGRALDHVPLPETPPALHTRQTVDAIGYPIDPTREEPQSSRGIVSAARPDGTVQLGMALNPGNSGGPVVDERETLVGLVFAGGRVTAGVQGVAIAVPIGPVAAAYREVLANGSLARAQRELRANLDERRLAADMVDALVRLDALAFLQEAANANMPFAPTTGIDQIEGLAHRMTDPFLQVLAAAWFWNAAAVSLERNGWGVYQPADLPPGPVRDFATRGWNRAIDLVGRALRTRPSLTRESGFVGAMVQIFPHLASGEAPRRADDPPAPAGPYEPRLTWFPTVAAAFVSEPFQTGYNAGFGLELSAPVWLFGEKGGTRIGPFVGMWLAWFAFEPPEGRDAVGDTAVWRGGALLGVTARVGRVVGLRVSAAWAPGRTHDWECEGDECVGEHSAAVGAARLGLGMSIANFTFGGFLHLSQPGLSMLVGLQVGTTFQ